MYYTLPVIVVLRLPPPVSGNTTPVWTFFLLLPIVCYKELLSILKILRGHWSDKNRKQNCFLKINHVCLWPRVNKSDSKLLLLLTKSKLINLNYLLLLLTICNLINLKSNQVMPVLSSFLSFSLYLCLTLKCSVSIYICILCMFCVCILRLSFQNIQSSSPTHPVILLAHLSVIGVP